MKELKNKISEITTVVRVKYPEIIIYLTGSYSTNTQISGSDIDVIILVDEEIKSRLISYLQNYIKNNCPQLTKKLDCKVLSKKEVKQSNGIDYLFLFSMLSTGTCLTERTFLLNLDPIKLREALIQIQERILELQDECESQRNFDFIAFALFSITKSLYYLYLIISPEKGRIKRVRDVLKKSFFPLCRIHEKYSQKGIQGVVNVSFSKREQRSGQFHILDNTFLFIKEYYEEVEKEFYNWFDKDLGYLN